jgi:hypothetical protein
MENSLTPQAADNNNVPLTKVPAEPVTKSEPPVSSAGSSPAPAASLTEAATVTPTPAPVPSESEVDEKIRLAKLAMEGPERTARREQQEKEFETKKKETEIKTELADLAKKKEELELAWIQLDTNRNAVKNLINPILEKENQQEQAETALEEQEKATVTARDKEAIEKKRQATELARQAIEKEKWIYQDRLFKIEDQIKDNTTAYQKLLDEEEKLRVALEQLGQGLI